MSRTSYEVKTVVFFFTRADSEEDAKAKIEQVVNKLNTSPLLEEGQVMSTMTTIEKYTNVRKLSM